MISISRIHVGMVVFAMVTPPFAGAAIMQFNDRMAWQAAVPGGGNLTEDFSAFTSDVIFRPGRITTGSAAGASGPDASRVRTFFNLNHAAFSMGTLVALGYDWNYLNLIDTPPLAFCGNNSLAQLFLNATEASRPGTFVRIDYTNPLSAWGADFYFARDSEHLAIDVLGAGDVVLGTIIVAANTSFLGFVATAGEEVHALLLRTELVIAGPTGEALCMDDLLGYDPP